MKKVLAMVCVLLFSAGALSAQNSLGGTRNSGSNNSGIFVSFGAGYGWNDVFSGYRNHTNDQYEYHHLHYEDIVLDAAAGYLFAINQKFAVGAGIGLHVIAADIYAGSAIKLFGQTQYAIPLNNELMFVGLLNLGIDFKNFTFLYEPSIGISKNNWTYSLKYSPQHYWEGIHFWYDFYALTLNVTYKF